MFTVKPVGPELSTVNVALGPAGDAWLPALSLAVPAAIEIPSVPSPVILLIVTVGVAVVPPVTATFPEAFPVELRIMSPAVKLIEVAPV
jgi:hypothetical protein